MSRNRDFYNEPSFERRTLSQPAYIENLAVLIRESLNPKAVFDAGCADGLLVQALRENDIEAVGRDSSKRAIDCVPAPLRLFCTLGSILDPIEGFYDLLTCIDVLEHMTPTDGELAVANLCQAAPRILFSQFPIDPDEPPSLNAQPLIYWLRLFARHNFGPCSNQCPDYLCSRLTLLEHRHAAPTEEELQAYASLVAAQVAAAQQDTKFNRLLESRLSPLKLEVEYLTKANQEAQDEIARLLQVRGQMRSQVDRLSKIERSTVWRATAPLRRSFDLLPGLRQIIRRSLRALRVLLSGRGLQGLKELRREANAIQAIAPLVDEAWYIESYPDVIGLDGGAAGHYYRYGAAEKRNPNPYFATEWYLTDRPDVAQSGTNPLLHYIRHGSQEGTRPSPEFDPAWYRATYPDVGFAGMEPLEHYLRYGAAEGRLSRASAPPRAVAAARMRVLKRPDSGEAVALFVTHAPGGRIKPHVPLYIAALRRENLAVTVIVATDLVDDVDTSALEPLVDGLLVRANEGFDFAAWAHAVRVVDLASTRLLILANDSVIGPLDSAAFSQIMARVRMAPEEIIGLTDNHEIQPHLQSYFLAAKNEAVPALEDFLARVVSISAKHEVIRAYEVPLTAAMKRRGLRTAALFPAPDSQNQTTVDWRALLKRGYPFVKTSALRSENSEDWREVIAQVGYDPAIAEESLKIIAVGGKLAPESVAPAPMLVAVAEDPALAVPGGLSTLAPDQPGRIAIIGHVFHIEQAAELRSILRNIPFACDVFLTTDDVEKKRRLEIVFARWPSGTVQVNVTHNRGRSIAPKLLTWRHVYNSYDYCLHIHSKEAPHDSALKNWRDFLFLTLAGSPEIVRTIFGVFAAAPDLGIVAPQHYEVVRRWVNWGRKFPMAQTLARRMGVELIEGAAHDFPSGSMFWARCAALRPLLDLELQVTDFDPEKGQADGTLATHAIEFLYFVSAEAAKMKWLKIGRTAYFEERSTLEVVADVPALEAFIKQHCWRIVDARRKPSTTPAKGIDLSPTALIADAQIRALGTDRPAPNLRIMVGVVTYNSDAELLARCLRSVRGVDRLFVWDNGAPSKPTADPSVPLTHRGGEVNLGFGAAHNRLMQEAFDAGADIYICLHPDGILHPEAIMRSSRMMAVRDGAALVELAQFPVDHSKYVDPVSLRTAWASGISLAISRQVHDVIGGFDDGFFMYCEDVDLSWRARAQGFEVVQCPNAYFAHSVTNCPLNDYTLRMMAESGARLARKWRAPFFERRVLGERPSAKPPRGKVERVPETWRDVADFDHDFNFSETRWS